MSSSFKVVFVGEDQSLKSALLLSIQQSRVTTDLNVPLCSTFDRTFFVHKRNVKIEFVDMPSGESSSKARIKYYKKTNLVVFVFNLAFNGANLQVIRNYMDECKQNCECPFLLCGITRVGEDIIISKNEITMTKKKLNSEYIEVNISEYGRIRHFYYYLSEQLFKNDEVGHTRKDGIKYACYSDQTCVAIESKSDCISVIPHSITYKFKEYTVKGIGYMREKYYFEKSNFKFENSSLIIPANSEITYIGNIDSSSISEIQISESVQRIHKNFFIIHCLFHNTEFKEPLCGKRICLIDKNSHKVSKTQYFEIKESDQGDVSLIQGNKLIAAKIRSSSFEIPENVKTIAQFSCNQHKVDSYNLSISFISIPDNVEKFGKFCFYSSKAEKIVFTKYSRLTKIGEYSFAKAKIIAINIPASCKEIQSGAFRFSYLENIEFGENSQLRYIGPSAFEETQIKSIKIPKNCVIIDKYCFKNCSQLKIIEIDDDSLLERIESEAFQNTRIEGIKIPKKLKYIGKRCFYGSKLHNIEFLAPSSLEQIEQYSFSATPIYKITLPRSLKKIDFKCFQECKGLKYIGLGKGSEAELPKASDISSIITNYELSSCYLDTSNNAHLMSSGPFIIDRKTHKIVHLCESIYLYTDNPTLITKDVTDFESNKKFIKQIQNISVQIDPTNEVDYIDLENFPDTMENLILSPNCKHVMFVESQKLQSLVITNCIETTLVFPSSYAIELEITCLRSLKLVIIPEKQSSNCRIKRENSLDYMPKKIEDILNEYVNRPNLASFESFVPDNYEVISYLNTMRTMENKFSFNIFKIQSNKNEFYCLKAFNEIKSLKKSTKLFNRDIKLLKYAEGPNIINVIGYESIITPINCRYKNLSERFLQNCCQNKIFFEYKEFYFLSYYLEIGKLHYLYTDSVKVILGICFAMKHLERIGVIKADLYPEHILFDKDFNTYICDLSCAGCDKLKLEIDTSMVNEDYLPEKAEDFSIATAVYSFGVITYQMIFQKLPFRDDDGNIVHELHIPEDKNLLPLAYNIIKSCLSLDPSQRPSFDQIINEIVENDFKFNILTESEKVKDFYDDILLRYSNENYEEVETKPVLSSNEEKVTEQELVVESEETNENGTICEINLGFEMPSSDSVSDLIYDIDVFDLIREIGSGSYGKVCLMENCLNGKEYAVKFINPGEKHDERAGEHFMNEIEILHMAIHPCIVRIYGYSLWSDTDNSAKIVLEYISNGTLSSNMSKLNDTQKTIVVVGICYGMRYLHRLDIIHRDLKPDNILLDDDFYPRITDFGISKFNDLGLTTTTTLGTPIYAAPEAFDGSKDNITCKVDVCSFGYILFELATGRTVYPEDITKTQLFGMKMRGEMSEIPSNVSDFTSIIIQACTSSHPSNRPTFDEIISHIKQQDFILFGNENVSEIRAYSRAIDQVEYDLECYYSEKLR